MSNSGKPFFVFWSLLAVPTLTILISNMGDTVVKAIKDVTIWLGEVTVLPSDEGSTLERLKYGLYKATLGRIDPKGKIKDEEELASDEDDFEELHPGLAKTLPRRRKQKAKRNEKKTEDRLASNMEETEKLEEDQARKKGDRIAEGLYISFDQMLSLSLTAFCR